MKKALPIIIVVIVIVVVVVLAIVFSTKEEGEEGAEVPTIKEGVTIAEEIYGFSAEIKGIKDKTLSLEAWIPLAEENEPPVKAMVKAVVTDQTKIVRLKFPEIEEGSEELVYPEETAMNFDELKVGDDIDIATIDNIYENVKNGTEFTASDIFIVE